MIDRKGSANLRYFETVGQGVRDATSETLFLARRAILA